jgi:hypothetical protein
MEGVLGEEVPLLKIWVGYTSTVVEIFYIPGLHYQGYISLDLVDEENEEERSI